MAQLAVIAFVILAPSVGVMWAKIEDRINDRRSYGYSKRRQY